MSFVDSKQESHSVDFVNLNRQKLVNETKNKQKIPQNIANESESQIQDQTQQQQRIMNWNNHLAKKTNKLQNSQQLSTHEGDLHDSPEVHTPSPTTDNNNKHAFSFDFQSADHLRKGESKSDQYHQHLNIEREKQHLKQTEQEAKEKDSQNQKELEDLQHQLKTIRTMKSPKQLDYEGTYEWLDLANKFFEKTNDIPTEMIIRYLNEIIKVFKQLGSALSFAFSDIIEKVGTVKERMEFYKEPMIFKMIQIEVNLNIHRLNGDNNKSEKAAPEYKKYNSAARQMLRLMRFMDFLHIMFREIVNNKEQTIKACLLTAYKGSLEQYHPWIIKTAARSAMGMAPKRKEFLYKIVETDKEEEFAYEVMSKMNEKMQKINLALREYYKQKNLENLP